MDFHLNLSIEMQTVDWNVALKNEIVSKTECYSFVTRIFIHPIISGLNLLAIVSI